jgi:hypothetical protein
MKDTVVFNRKTGQIGLKKCLGDDGFKDKGWGDHDKEWGSNYAVFPMDPITFDWSYQVREQATTDWKPLPNDDPRVQFVELFETIYGADWYHSFIGGDDNTEIDEYYIQNEHRVFQQIRKIFGG